ncbi:MAG: hypothetical protein R2732_10345 [Microbacteriaceae bacterium]
MTDATTGTTAVETNVPTESIMVGGELTARQSAILERAARHRYVTGRTVIERGDTYVLLRGKRGGLTVLITMLYDASKDEAEAVLELHRRFPSMTLRVLVPEVEAINYLFNVEGVADHYMKTLVGYIDTPSRAIAGASFHPLHISDWDAATIGNLSDGSWEAERVARARDEERAAFVKAGGEELAEFCALWARVLSAEVCVTLDDGDEAFVMYEWAVDRSARDSDALLRAAFERGIRDEFDLRSWLWDAVEQELHELAEERIALRDSEAAAA